MFYDIDPKHKLGDRCALMAAGRNERTGKEFAIWLVSGEPLPPPKRWEGYTGKHGIAVGDFCWPSPAAYKEYTRKDSNGYSVWNWYEPDSFLRLNWYKWPQVHPT